MATTRSIRQGEQIVGSHSRWSDRGPRVLIRNSGTHMVTPPTRTCFAAMGTSIRSRYPVAVLGTLPILSKFALILLWQLLNKDFLSSQARGARSVSAGGWKRVVTSA